MSLDCEAIRRTLIVARMNPGDALSVASIFGESDAGGLPHLVGVHRRDLFHFHDLYFHLIESSGDIGVALSSVRSNPLFTEVNTKLAEYVSPFEPATWRGPRDSMAQPFYSWTARQGPTTARS